MRSARDVYLQALDHAWGHPWESLAAALDGVAEAEAVWQAPCYAAEESEEGWPPPGTIHWQVAHVAHCKRYYTALITARGSAEPPPQPAREPGTSFEEDRAALEVAHAAQRQSILGLQAADLAAVVANGMPLGEFLAMTIRHDTWHASQIALARRLWRTRA